MPSIKKKKEDTEEQKEGEEQKEKIVVLHRAVPMEDMMNSISDKLDIVITQIQEVLKLAKEE